MPGDARTVLAAPTLFLASFLAACQPPPDDLAGGPETELRLADAPSGEIGRVDGPDESILDDLAGAARLEDGGVVVALGRPSQVRRYDPDGELRWSVGREGEGPGEYGDPVLWNGCVGTAGILVYDRVNVRVTVLDVEDGSVVDTWAMRHAPYDAACSPDGRFVYTRWGEEPSDPGPYRALQPLYAWRGGDSEPNLLRERVPGDDRWFYGEGSSGPRPWSRRIRLAPSNEGVWLFTGDAYEVEFLDWEGRVARVARWTGPELAVAPEDVAAHRDRYVSLRADEGDDPARIRELEQRWRRLEAEQLPDAFPSVDRAMSPGTGEGIWLRHYARPRDAGATWVHLDDSGAWRRVLRIPERMRLMDVGPDWALVRVRDDFDRDVLRVYALVEAT